LRITEISASRPLKSENKTVPGDTLARTNREL
jgi:hypothetical protein